MRELVRTIDHYVTHYNNSKRPFIWTATADSIFDKPQRLCRIIIQRKAPFLLRRPLEQFAGVAGSSIYDGLQSEAVKYLAFVLRKEA